MARKTKVVTNQEQAIKVARRGEGGKKRPDLMANVRALPHPMDEMVGLPATAEPGSPSVDSDVVESGHPGMVSLGANAPRLTAEAPRQDESLGAQTPRLSIPGHSKNVNWREHDKRRSTVRVNLHISKELDQKVRRYCLESNPRLELKEFFEAAALHFLGTQEDKHLGAWAPHDDRRLMMFSTRANIINLYRAYNPKNKWKMSDDKVASGLNEVDPRLIELGIIRTQFNAGFKRINSFSYYLAEIEHWQETPFDDKMLDFLVKHDRAQWERATGRKLELPAENAPE